MPRPRLLVTTPFHLKTLLDANVALPPIDLTLCATAALAPLAPKRTFIAGRQQPGSKRTHRRLARYRTGTEGRISHLKRRYGLRRSRLKGHQGQQTWTGWAILAYNLDTLAVRSA